MDLLFHGGMCCGIKTIKGFSWGKPDNPWDRCLETKKTSSKDNDSRGRDVSSSMSFFSDAAPAETQEERLARLIAFCKRVRPKGAIEAVLADARLWEDGKAADEFCDCGECSVPCSLTEDGQVGYWGPILESHGFKLSVPPFLNSNSGNYIYIYHLVYDATKEPTPKTVSSVPEPFGRSV